MYNSFATGPPPDAPPPGLSRGPPPPAAPPRPRGPPPPGIPSFASPPQGPSQSFQKNATRAPPPKGPPPPRGPPFNILGPSAPMSSQIRGGKWHGNSFFWNRNSLAAHGKFGFISSFDRS